MPTFNPRAALRRALPALPEYAALEDTNELAARFGIKPEEIVKVDGNENPYGPSPKALEVLARVAYPVHQYGDADQKALRAALSAHLGVPADAIV